MNLYVPEIERGIFNEFNSKYDPYLLYGFDGKLEKKLKDKGARVCRFCKRKSPDVLFNSKAHLFPYLLGNKNHIWDEECDNCNGYFGLFETHLSYYLGILRTLHSIKGGDKAPVFSSKDANVEFRRLNNGMLLFDRKDSNSGIDFNINECKLEIDVARRPYIPAYVYAAFLKIALSVLPEQDVAGYRYAYNYILDRANFNSLQGPRRIVITECNYEYDSPFVSLFKVKEGIVGHPRHLMAVYVKSFMFQIAFPIHISEISEQGRDMIVPNIPYVDFGRAMKEPVEIKRYEDDLHGTEAVNDTKSKFVMNFNAEDLKNLISIPMPENFISEIEGKLRHK